MKCIKSLKNLLINFLLPLKWNYVTCMHGDRTQQQNCLTDIILLAVVCQAYECIFFWFSSCIYLNIIYMLCPLCVNDLTTMVRSQKWKWIKEKEKVHQKIIIIYIMSMFRMTWPQQNNKFFINTYFGEFSFLLGWLHRKCFFFSSFESQRMRYILCIVV